MKTVTVVAGDTLSGIAQRLNVSVASLLKVNSLHDPNLIQVGQTLQIPELTTDQSDHPTPPPPRRSTGGDVPIDRRTFRLPPSQFFPQKQPKDLIVLHFTAGASARSAYQTWISTPVEVATPYLVDPDGTIYELFDPECWAYHLGIQGAASESWRHDRRSIPIEIVNVGPLKQVDDHLCWWPNKFQQRFCALTETDKYVQNSYRGMTHFAAFPEAQQNAVGGLVGWLSAQFNIPMNLPPLDRRGQFDVDFYRDWKGIASHQNFRLDKTDLGPAFDWTRLG